MALNFLVFIFYVFECLFSLLSFLSFLFFLLLFLVKFFVVFSFLLNFWVFCFEFFVFAMLKMYAKNNLFWFKKKSLVSLTDSFCQTHQGFYRRTKCCKNNFQEAFLLGFWKFNLGWNVQRKRKKKHMSP